MAEQKPKYIIIFLMLAVVAGLTWWVRSKPAEAKFSADFTSFPKVIGSLKGVDQPLSKQTLADINADSCLCRLYSDPGSDKSAQLLVVYRKYGRRGFVHRPEMCYPASGYELVTTGYTTVPYNGRNVRAVKLTAVNGADKQLVIYWYASGERTQANFVWQQVAMALDRLQPSRYGWAFIRLSVSMPNSEQEAVERARKFLVDARRPLAACLTENAKS